MNLVLINSIENNKQFREFLKENLDGKLFTNRAAIGIGFNGRALLLQCVGKEKIQAVNNSKKTLENRLQKIEDVLGNVPVVEELRQDIHKFMESISAMFDYANEK